MINSNPATIMTDKVVADNIYLLPLEPASILQILSEHNLRHIKIGESQELAIFLYTHSYWNAIN